MIKQTNQRLWRSLLSLSGSLGGFLWGGLLGSWSSGGLLGSWSGGLWLSGGLLGCWSLGWSSGGYNIKVGKLI